MSIPAIPVSQADRVLDPRRVFEGGRTGLASPIPPGGIARRAFSDVLRESAADASRSTTATATSLEPGEVAGDTSTSTTASTRARATLPTPDPREPDPPVDDNPTGGGDLPDSFGPPGTHGDYDAETGRYSWWNQNGWIVLDTPGPGTGGTDQQLLTPSQHEALLMLEARNPNWLHKLVQDGVPLTYRNDIDEQGLFAAQRSGDTRAMYEALGIPPEYADVLPAGVEPYTRQESATTDPEPATDPAPVERSPFKRTA